MKLPLRERILNAYAGGFAPSWIADRFGVTPDLVRGVLERARRRGDERAPYASKTLSLHRRRMTLLKRSFEKSGCTTPDVPDEFPDLPPVTDPILPFGGRIPQSVEDAP